MVLTLSAELRAAKQFEGNRSFRSAHLIRKLAVVSRPGLYKVLSTAEESAIEGELLKADGTKAQAFQRSLKRYPSPPLRIGLIGEAGGTTSDKQKRIAMLLCTLGNNMPSKNLVGNDGPRKSKIRSMGAPWCCLSAVS